MSLKIVKQSEPMIVERINMAIYSPPGLGKSTLAFTAHNPILLDCDKGAYRAANRKDAVEVNSWDDIAVITASDLEPYNTVILDTAGRALDFLTQDIIAKNPKMGRGGALTLQGFGELKAKFAAWLRMVRTFGKDVILIAHMDEQRSGDDVIERLDVQGGSKGEIYKSVDAMGRLFTKNGKRYVDFNPRENSFGKNPCNLDVLEVPLADGEFLGKLLATIKERLNKSSEVAKKADLDLQYWNTVLAECSTCEDMNTVLPEVMKAEQRIKFLAHARARELKLAFNQTTKQYEKAA